MNNVFNRAIGFILSLCIVHINCGQVIEMRITVAKDQPFRRSSNDKQLEKYGRFCDGMADPFDTYFRVASVMYTDCSDSVGGGKVEKNLLENIPSIIQTDLVKFSDQ